MEQEIINYTFDEDLENVSESEYSNSFVEPHEGLYNQPLESKDKDISYVNGHNLPDEEEDEEEDDLILGDEDELDEEDLVEDEIDVELDDEVDADISEEDLVLDVESADDEDEEDDL